MEIRTRTVLMVLAITFLLQIPLVAAREPGGGGGGSSWIRDYAPYYWGATGNSGNMELVAELHVAEWEGGHTVIEIFEVLPQTAFGQVNVDAGQIRIKTDTESGYAWAMVVGNKVYNPSSSGVGVDVSFNGILDAYLRGHQYGGFFSYTEFWLKISMYDANTGERLGGKTVFHRRIDGGWWGDYTHLEVDEVFYTGEVQAHFTVPMQTEVMFGIGFKGMHLGDGGAVWRDQGVPGYAYLSVNSIAWKFT